MPQSTKDFSSGLFWAAIAIVIWSGSIVMLRLGVTTTLNAYDLAALRIGVSALLLIPVIFRHGFARAQLGLGGLAVVTLGFGAPYVLLVSLGLQFAPASAAGAINPGLMAVFVVLANWCFLGEKTGLEKIIGSIAILAGTALFSDFLAAGDALIGHGIFSFTAAMWAGYTLVIRRSRVPALHATAIVAVGSAILYLPIYAALLPKRLPEAPLSDILSQAIFQGVFVSVIAVFAFTRSVEKLGAPAGAALPALIPLTTLGLGMAALGEPAGPKNIMAACLIGAGVLFSLAPRRRRLAKTQ